MLLPCWYTIFGGSHTLILQVRHFNLAAGTLTDISTRVDGFPPLTVRTAVTLCSCTTPLWPQCHHKCTKQSSSNMSSALLCSVMGQVQHTCSLSAVKQVSQSGRHAATFVRHTTYVWSPQQPKQLPLHIHATKAITVSALPPPQLPVLRISLYRHGRHPSNTALPHALSTVTVHTTLLILPLACRSYSME